MSISKTSRNDKIQAAAHIQKLQNGNGAHDHDPLWLDDDDNIPPQWFVDGDEPPSEDKPIRKQRLSKKDVDPGDMPDDEWILGGNVLFDDRYKRMITFSVPFAEMIGLNESIALQSVHSWCTTNQNNRKRHMKKGIRNYFDGHWWTFQTWKQWRQGSFPFWSDKTVRRTFESLERQNMIVIVKHDNDKRGQYFRVNYQEVYRLIQQFNAKNPDEPLSMWHREYHDILVNP